MSKEKDFFKIPPGAGGTKISGKTIKSIGGLGFPDLNLESNKTQLGKSVITWSARDRQLVNLGLADLHSHNAGPSHDGLKFGASSGNKVNLFLNESFSDSFRDSFAVLSAQLRDSLQEMKTLTNTGNRVYNKMTNSWTQLHPLVRKDRMSASLGKGIWARKVPSQPSGSLAPKAGNGSGSVASQQPIRVFRLDDTKTALETLVLELPGIKPAQALKKMHGRWTRATARAAVRMAAKPRIIKIPRPVMRQLHKITGGWTGKWEHNAALPPELYETVEVAINSDLTLKVHTRLSGFAWLVWRGEVVALHMGTWCDKAKLGQLLSTSGSPVQPRSSAIQPQQPTEPSEQPASKPKAGRLFDNLFGKKQGKQPPGRLPPGIGKFRQIGNLIFMDEIRRAGNNADIFAHELAGSQRKLNNWMTDPSSLHIPNRSPVSDDISGSMDSEWGSWD